MQRFSKLLNMLDLDGSTTYKVEVLAGYFREAPPDDAVWALYLLLGRRLKRRIKRRQLFDLIQDAARLPEWLFDECYAVVGDLAETFALLWPGATDLEQPQDPVSLRVWMTDRCSVLPTLDTVTAAGTLRAWLHGLSRQEVLFAIKLLTGGFRAGVARGLVVKALAQAFSQDPSLILEALSGDWPVTGDWYTQLANTGVRDASSLAPLPFYLASPLTVLPEELGAITDFCVEWKWDGIRAQVIKVGEHIAIWSRGEELITDCFPEIAAALRTLEVDCILDGEVLVVKADVVRPFSELQTRLGRKKTSAKLMSEMPVKFFAFDCLRRGPQDLRAQPLRIRRAELEDLLNRQGILVVSPRLSCEDWQTAHALRATSRSRGVEGLMLKAWEAPYRMGRKRGEFWKWKIEPMTLDAVLIYAQAGHGRRATLYTDYTFALWQGEQLVPFAKAYSGLDDPAIIELDSWIRKHTKERFGPVRSVEPLRVFEIAFEGINRSSRHKSGIAVRFPRIVRERIDKAPQDADTVEQALGLCRKDEC